LNALVDIRTRVGLALAGIALTLATGCPVVQNLPAPGRTLQQKDPEQRRDYSLYIPSYYKSDRAWPLLVTCHGTRPYDTAPRQLTEWKGLAEQKGFLLAVPELNGTSAGLAPPAAEQIRRQLDDEAAILSIVRTVSAAYNVDPAKVFLTGWSAGGFAVAFTGLRHPDVFRALSLRQPNFDPAYVELCVPFLDRNQPIQVMFGDLDPLKPGASKCVEWLRAHDFEPVVNERPGSHKRDPSPVYAFLSDTVRHGSWVRVQVQEDGTDPMRLLLGARSSFKPVKYLWDFGDGSPRVADASPAHRYTQPGEYNIRVGVWVNEKEHVLRQVQVKVPRVRLGTATPPSTAPAGQ
jgi:acetyl esterase/lipase